MASRPYASDRLGSAVLTPLQENRPAILIILHAASAAANPAIGLARDFLATGSLSMVLASTETFVHLDEHPGLGILARGMSGISPR